eukprot:Opistho-2@74644
MADGSKSAGSRSLAGAPAASPGQPPTGVDDYVMLEKIGSGSYSVVHRAKHTDTGNVVAAKCISRKKIGRDGVDNIVAEISILQKADHPHIVRLLDYRWDTSSVWLIMEHCSGGDLARYIAAKGRLSEPVARHFLRQLASALRFLHSIGVTHCDLKPSNILLLSRERPVLKLADFGFAQHLTDADKALNLRGSLLYMAPEIIVSYVSSLPAIDAESALGAPCNRGYDSRVDLWSVGVILYEALFGKAPFHSTSEADVIAKLQSNEPVAMPEAVAGVHLSFNCRDLLLRLLKRRPDERISYADFFAHPFVDLEHLPSGDSLEKAIDILSAATAKDRDGDVREAVHLYTQGIEFLLAAVQFEQNAYRKDGLRKQVRQYLERAEVLKNKKTLTEKNGPQINRQGSVGRMHAAQSRDGGVAPAGGVDDHDSYARPTNDADLRSLAGVSESIATALYETEEASRADRLENFPDALARYGRAIGHWLAAGNDPKLAAHRRRIAAEATRLMDRAEDLKLSLGRRSLESPTPSLFDGSFLDGGACCIQ